MRDTYLVKFTESLLNQLHGGVKMSHQAHGLQPFQELLLEECLQHTNICTVASNMRECMTAGVSQPGNDVSIDRI
jgi:hypothetical protein